MYSITNDYVKEKKEAEENIAQHYTPLQNGAILYKNGELDKAAELFSKMLEIDPSNFESRIMLAEIYQNQCIKKDTNCELALWQLDYLVKTFPNKILPLEMRSKLFLKLNDTISARNDVVTISKLK